ncbi:MAG: L-aspartate oxidase [Planctomycetota bacterium]
MKSPLLPPSPVERHVPLDLEDRLLSVDSRKVPLFRFDILVVGTGAAGSSAALAAAEAGAEVAILTKADPEETNTLFAQGGMAAVLAPEDSLEQHVADTLRVGYGLAEPEVVEAVVRGGPAAVKRLLGWGARFDRRGDGEIDLSREGGHTCHRVVHARGDATGREIQEAVLRALGRHPRITLFPHTFLIDLLHSPEGRVVGALASTHGGDLAVFAGGQTILATGGAGQLFRETTNPAIATGDGVAAGWRAGAILRDLEFVQFHPTLLYIAGAARVLISEVVRGHGGRLVDRHGVRFMPEHHPDAELAPRDVVARAIFERMVQTQDTSVYLDLSALDEDPHRLFPAISRICRFFGIDIARDPVPVRPGAHYMVGGLEVDVDGRTSVTGLWAVGECASSGLHGANRMGSNSLLEGLVLGTRAGETAATEAVDRGLQDFEVRPPRDREVPPAGMQVNIEDVTYSLKSLLWRQLGIERDGERIRDVLDKIALWTRAVSALAPPQPRTWELCNMLTVARLTAISALVREESRGSHYRTDHPAPDPAWVAHTRLVPRFSGDRLEGVDVSRAPVGASAPAV